MSRLVQATCSVLQATPHVRGSEGQNACTAAINVRFISGERESFGCHSRLAGGERLIEANGPISAPASVPPPPARPPSTPQPPRSPGRQPYQRRSPICYH